MRLQKYMADAGIASRRVCEGYILEGRVKVNGKIINELGRQVEESDKIVFDGNPVSLDNDFVYYLLNKPPGYVTTVKDEKDRPTVIQLIKDPDHRIFPIGRLDYNTAGLLLLTNDGSLTYALTHPKHNVNKTYHVKVKGLVDKNNLKRLEEGVMIEGKKTARAKVDLIRYNQTSTVFNITIHEGRNRQIRKMCEAIHHQVVLLERIAIGELKIGSLEQGAYRTLTKSELCYLREIAGINTQNQKRNNK